MKYLIRLSVFLGLAVTAQAQQHRIGINSSDSKLASLLSPSDERVMDARPWPFSDTMFYFSYTIYGNYSQNGNEINPQIGNDTSWSKTWSGSSLSGTGFMRSDLQSVDSDVWHLSRSNYSSNVSLDLTIDTVHHIISNFSYHGYNNAYPGQTDDLDLSNLRYSQSGFEFPDNDFNRHVTYVNEDVLIQNSFQWVHTTFCCCKEVDIFGTQLISALQLPDTVNFDTVNLGTNRDTLITIRNFSDTALRILSYSLTNPDSGFSVLDTTLHYIPAGGSGTIRVRFNASERKTYTGSITLITDEAISNRFAITLWGSVPEESSVKTEVPVSNIEVSPNPVSRKAILHFSSTRLLENVVVALYDRIGQAVDVRNIGNVNPGMTEVPIMLPPLSGLWYLRVTAEGQALAILPILIER